MVGDLLPAGPGDEVVAAAGELLVGGDGRRSAVLRVDFAAEGGGHNDVFLAADHEERGAARVGEIDRGERTGGDVGQRGLEDGAARGGNDLLGVGGAGLGLR